MWRSANINRLPLQYESVLAKRRRLGTLRNEMSDDKAIVPVERIERLIYLIRGQKVMLDSDLAEIYGVTTKRLNEQVGRNADRFPPDFAFQLTPQEVTNLRSQIATSSLESQK